ncbi:MAG: protein-L-isoaspartate(D-aspartate) O-methyltransferase [archaeon]
MNFSNVFAEKRKLLIESMLLSGAIKSSSVKKAFLSVNREEFFPKDILEYSYADSAFSIGYNQTISQPSTIAMMLELLAVEKNQNVLEIGAGSGYVLALLAEIVGKKGKVYGIDIVPELAMNARTTLAKLGYENIEIYHSDGTLGLKDFSPFDRILFSAACPEIPKPVINQLNKNGIIVAPVGKYQQWMHILKKDSEGKISGEVSDLGPFVFVPLKGKYGFD